MSVKIGSARIDENGRASGGKAGDQTGKEVSTQSWYNHTKGWRVFRAIDPVSAEKIAVAMERACANQHIGYDQSQRNTLYKAAEPFGFDPGKVTTDVECDCSALVRVCCAYAGIMSLPSDFRTGNMPTNLGKTGAFVELKGDKYQCQSTYLGRGDILVTKTSGHTVVVLSNGSKYEGSVAPHAYSLGERVLKHGDEGADVKSMQEQLITLGYDLGKWGADSDFGDCTELALLAFQRQAGIEADGECGPITIEALSHSLDAMQSPSSTEEKEKRERLVTIVGGNCYIRSEPNTDGKKLGVAHNGELLPWAGAVSEGGWNAVTYNGTSAWVSGKYSILT